MNELKICNKKWSDSGGELCHKLSKTLLGDAFELYIQARASNIYAMCYKL